MTSSDEEDKFEIRCIKAEEIYRMPEWIYKEVGWTTNDSTFLKLCYDLDPHGWFVAVTPIEGIIGTVLSVNLNDHYSFAGLYLVSRNHRSRGIGKKLWNAMLGHVAHRCLGINSVKDRVFSNLKMGMTPPLFKVSIFNGSLKRNAHILHSSLRRSEGPCNNKIINDLTHLSTLNKTTCNHEIEHNTKENEHNNESDVIDAKNPHTYFNIQTNCKNDYLIDDEIDLKETTRKGYNDPSPLDDKRLLKDPFYNSLCTRSGDLARYNDKVKLQSNTGNINVVFMDGIDINLATLRDYDATIHGGLIRENFLKTLIQLSAENDLTYKVRCIVATKFVEMEICGYGIIRPRGLSISKNNNETHTCPNARDSASLTAVHYLIIGPLYADNPEIAHTLLKALLDSVPSEWEINVELTVPLKMKDGHNTSNNSMLNTNFLYTAATTELGLRTEEECYRMYQNNVPHTLDECQENAQESKPIKSNFEENHVDKTLECVPTPEILMEKIYSFVSSDMFLD
ncbi:unnamed protein product [Gordionus sp. m RMFG-2023]|uniref:uncharacterized protein LOC135928587 n=1 Tax=Gordionus sp. m RMFG-2023 TaxID=3053472 RepID=UPI0030E3F0CB